MADGWITVSYNALNQPVAAWSSAYPSQPAQFLWFGYDPLGRCVKRWMSLDTGNAANSNPATYYYYDGWDLIQEGTTANSATRLYVHGNRVDEIVASFAVSSNQWAFHHYDARGHCIMLTNTSIPALIMEQYDYDAFGKTYFYTASGASATVNGKPGSPWGNRFLFTGREWLSDLRIYDYRARMYQPELGRFLQPDPKQFAAGDYNLYRYCHNDPVNKTDPFGLVPPGDGLMDLPRKTVQEMKEAMKDNIKNTETKSVYDPNGKPVKQEFRTTNFTNGSEEQPASTPGGYHPPGSKPTAPLPADPFKGAGRPTWDTHSHISGSGKPYAPGDINAANFLRVPSGVQSATGGPMYIFVPSATRGGQGGLFRLEGNRLINDATGQEAPH